MTRGVKWRTDPCRICDEEFSQPVRRGRPRELCDDCAAERPLRVAAKKRAYREENRDEIAAKQRARQIEDGRVCAECGVRLRKTDEPGPRVCGFCRDEAA